MKDDQSEQLEAIKAFYDSTYYSSSACSASNVPYFTQLAKRIGVAPGTSVLDVACGLGSFLTSCRALGAAVSGVDLSVKAIQACALALPDGTFFVSPAETLPFKEATFDFVTCLGALEHFVNPGSALSEMLRVSKKKAKFLFLVPNADFLTRRLGLFGGTNQTAVKEDVKTLDQWSSMFRNAGFVVNERWRDLHVLSWSWIAARGWLQVPLRAAQALALPLWPLRWQYQVYFLCTRTHEE